MSSRLINHSPDLKKLRDEGYNLEIRSGYLLVNDVPYLNCKREIKTGILVFKLTLAGDITTKPEDHTAHFIGEYPCEADGREIEQIRNQSCRRAFADVTIDHTFSAKPHSSGSYEDYYEKVTIYVAILAGRAQLIDPLVTAKTFPTIEPEDEESPFNYRDTASSRAEIDLVTNKLALSRVAIIGLGGTGAYVLDLIAKTPIKEIHLFDGDDFLQHNAFRAPGAASIQELKAKPRKVTYLKNIYSKMHRGIVTHEENVDEENVEQLKEMGFAFLCFDSSNTKKVIMEKLIEYRIPFVDVGLGVYMNEDQAALGGILRVTTSTPEKYDHLSARIPYSDGGITNAYISNIQIADLNALNAALAVIRWKKVFGFYLNYDPEYYSAYTIDSNFISNDEKKT